MELAQPCLETSRGTTELMAPPPGTATHLHQCHPHRGGWHDWDKDFHDRGVVPELPNSFDCDTTTFHSPHSDSLSRVFSIPSTRVRARQYSARLLREPRAMPPPQNSPATCGYFMNCLTLMPICINPLGSRCRGMPPPSRRSLPRWPGAHGYEV